MNNLTTSSNEQHIYAEQVKIVLSGGVTAMLGSIVAASILVAIQWNVVDNKSLIIWLICLIFYNLIRAIMMHRFIKLNPSDEQCQKAGKLFFASSIIVGLIWSIGVVLSFPVNNFTYQLTLAVVVVAISAGAVSTLSELRESFIAFVFPIIFTLAILFVYEGTDESKIVAVGLLAALGFIYSGSNSIYTASKQTLQLLLQANEREKTILLAKNETESTNRAMAQFITNLSHELRTPLHAVLAYADLGLEKIGTVPEEKIKSFLLRIKMSGDRLMLLVDDILEIGKLESGKLKLEMKDEEISQVINSCVNEQKLFMDSKKVDVKYNLPADLPKVFCDKLRIEQVITNLLSNSLKFSPDNGTIFISGIEDTLRDNDGKNIPAIHISIKDQGQGIPEDEIEEVFDSFIQSEKHINNVEGTGLGLAISRGIIEMHHGKIWCNNDESGGAVFHFVLPV